MKKTFLYALCTVTACLCCAGGYFALEGSIKTRQAREEREREIKILARNQSDKGIFTQEEYKRIARIKYDSAKLSEDDFKFLVDTVASPSVSTDELAGFSRKVTVVSAIGMITEANRVSAQQREQIIPLISGLLKAEDSKKYGQVHEYALSAARKLKDPRLVPDILPLVNDPLPNVADAAKKTLIVLGYKP